MSKCIMEEECTEIKEIRNQMDKDRKMRVEADRFWIRIMVTLGLIIAGALILTWAKADIVPNLKLQVDDHEKRLTRTETRQEAILDNTKKILKRLDNQL